MGVYSLRRGHVIYTFYRRTSPAFDLYTISLQRCVHDIFFTKRRVGVTLVLLYTFHHFSSTLQKTLDRSPCEYENAGHGRKRRIICSEPRLN